MEIGKRIAWMRDKKGWTQKELADRAGLNKSVMNRIETGERPLKDQELKVISDLLDVTSDYLLGKSNDPRLSADQQKEVDGEFKELKKIIESLPLKEQERIKQRILDYAKGLSDSAKDRESH